MKRIISVFVVALLASLPACHSSGPLPPPNYQGIDPSSPDIAWRAPTGVGPQRFGASLIYPQQATARSLDAALRGNLLTRSQGMFAETFPRSASVLLGTVTIDGTVYFSPIALLAGDVVTNLSIAVTAAAVGITLSKVGLYSLDGTLLASSVDQGSSWQATGMKTIAMSTPYIVTASGAYFVAIVAKAATTLPSIARSISIGAPGAIIGLAVGSGALPYAVQTGQTDLPAPATPVSSSTSIVFWFGAS